MKHLLLALLSGILLAIAWPTYGISLFVFIAWVPLLLVEYQLRSTGKACKGKVFLLCYLSFLLWNTLTTWWIWNSTVVGALFALLVNSLLMSLIFLAYHLVAKRNTAKVSSIFLVAIWIAFEKFHHHWDFSWPWLSLGNVFSENITWIQWYEYTGIFGGSLWVLLVNILLFHSLHLFLETKDKRLFYKRVTKISLLVLLPIAFSWGIYISYKEKGTPIEVVALQPNIDPYEEKYSLSNGETISLLLTLAKEGVTENTHFVLTPETVISQGVYRLEEVSQNKELAPLHTFLEEHPQLNWVMGTAIYQVVTDKSKIAPQTNYNPAQNYWFNDYNSAFLLNSFGIMGFHHKSKLVVGVENMPLQSLLKPILGDIMIDLGGTVAVKTTQETPSVLSSLSEEKVAPVICYESIYGEYVGQYVKQGAQFLSVLTNDAWWGDTQGYKQLLSYTRLRAIETRKSIARSANTGISAFISQRGEIISSLGYGKKGALRGTVLANNQLTTYVRYGDYIARLCAFVGIGIFLVSFLKKRSEV
ncbi:apolipoprotein N-acyltransferase [uncultured Capnocytophaga sp.]|uniref:apolipoprotein N-acyltransferase n=1 Tax=uncultured Capnocytophaga sp. TaxID=159273 RepID=UPI00261BCCFF|nr:apolipoprotein N-acyltransferase [uncultured Capnocytophaga sp.]